MGFNMSYTSFSVAAPGRAYDGVTVGSDQWNELLGKQMAILEAAGTEQLLSGYAAAIGKFVNVNKYESVEKSSTVIAQLAAAQLIEVEASGPFISFEEWFELIG
ncbi:MAG: hypothetical protein CL464_04485 [Acidimicrobiaceae bacterium]|jgi:hypothetical protein|nr:hypothetical protein [Acidimicrobiaceae bacterium]MBQ29255.1 hypothetical protein [Acidimicrobiaceae bacterium]|tara:strand:- start:7689 stop:8000 length:312 start_codon:yes stop_codon:yes gene_type:complete